MATGNPQTTAASASAAATATATTSALSAESLTFDGIAKHFNMPIADAAVALGVCSSVLKKICRDNGLVRWPYRKFLAGKSVEEIQKDAAREKKREMLELARAARQKDAIASSVTASSNTQQQGNNLSQDGLRNDGLQSGSGRNIQVYMDEFKQGNVPAHLDEFKQGFPSNGLSTVTMRWWGGHSSDATEDEILGEEPAVDGVNEQHTNDLADEEESKEEETNTMPRKSDIGPQGVSLLTSVRERAAAEGRQALKLGVYGGHRSFKLNRREKLLLLKVFRSSLPSQWIDSS